MRGEIGGERNCRGVSGRKGGELPAEIRARD